MGWWSRAVSAVKSAVNKAVSAVKSVVSSVSRTVSNVVKSVSSAVSSVASSVSRAVSNTVSRASSAVSRVVNTVKDFIRAPIDKAAEVVETVKNTIVETLWEGQEVVKDKVDEVKSSAKDIVSTFIEQASSYVIDVTSSVKGVASSSVNKILAHVESIKDHVKGYVFSSVEKAKEFYEHAADTIKRYVDDTIKAASSSVSRVVNTIKKTASDVVVKVVDAVKKTQDTAKEITSIVVKKVEDAVDKVKDVVEKTVLIPVVKVAEEIKAIDWKRVFLEILRIPYRKTYPLLGWPRFDAVNFIYTAVTGKTITEAESFRLKAKIFDWIVPLNALSVLFTGKNLSGEPEEFGTFEHYADIVFALAIFIPAGKVGKVALKLGFKAGTKFGLKGFIKFAVTKLDDAARLFSKLNVDDQAKLIGKLSKTDEGVKIINLLLGKKALHATLVKPTISIVNKKIAESILRGARLSRFIPVIVKPKTILGSIMGLAGLLGLAYGIPFGTSWMAKEGIKEQFEIPLSDRMRDYRFEPTAELREIILSDIKKLREALPIAEATIRAVAWLWPPTKETWEFYADNIYFTIEQYEKELELIIIPELVVLPETIKGVVRDVIDGDTLDVSLDAIDATTGKDIKLFEYAKTGHARIRIVGINAPEKSPKGEILCSDVEIFNVEKKFADESRDRLLPLNDKEVILKIDPEISMDTYGRILSVVEFQGEDIGLRQINEGLACGYYREPHKYFDEAEYSSATLTAKSEGIGMWAGLEEIEKEEDKIKIKITSTPTNARLFLDDTALRHNTPSDEVELSDVIHLFTLGKHVLSAEKAGLSAMGDIEIVKGDNGTLHLDLVTAPFPEVPTPEEVVEEEIKEELIEEKIEEVKIEEEIIPEVKEPVRPADIPKEYTTEQEWALNEAFAKVLELTEGRAIMSEKERGNLFASFAFYTDVQKEVITLLMKDITFYTKGREQISADDFILLKEKYRML